jgi:hypothetical protein
VSGQQGMIPLLAGSEVSVFTPFYFVFYDGYGFVILTFSDPANFRKPFCLRFGGILSHIVYISLLYPPTDLAQFHGTVFGFLDFQRFLPEYH